MKYCKFLILNLLLLIVLTACSNASQEQVEKDVLTYLEAKYGKAFAIAEYELKSNAGLGYDNHHLQVYPQGEVNKQSFARIRYFDDASFIISDRHVKYTEKAKENRKVLDDILSNHAEKFTYESVASSEIKFGSRDALKKFKFNQKKYGDRYLLEIAITTKEEKSDHIQQQIIKRIVTYYKNRSKDVAKLVINLTLYPEGTHIEGKSLYDLKVINKLEPIDSVTVDFDKAKLIWFDGSSHSLRKVIRHR